MEKKPIYNKYIDFSINKSEHKAEKRNVEIFASVVIALILITFTWTFYLYSYISDNMKMYSQSVDKNQINEIPNLNNDILALESENKNLSDKAKMVDAIKNDEIDYMSILDNFRKGLPSNVSVKSIIIKNTGDVDITLNINNSTLDVAKTVIAINKLNIFEEFEISDVKLDDTVNSAEYNLKIKK